MSEPLANHSGREVDLRSRVEAPNAHKAGRERPRNPHRPEFPPQILRLADEADGSRPDLDVFLVRAFCVVDGRDGELWVCVSPDCVFRWHEWSRDEQGHGVWRRSFLTVSAE